LVQQVSGWHYDGTCISEVIHYLTYAATAGPTAQGTPSPADPDSWLKFLRSQSDTAAREKFQFYFAGQRNAIGWQPDTNPFGLLFPRFAQAAC
jgi:hypothetical protein